MTLLKSIAVVTALFYVGIVLASNTQDDAACSDPNHMGFTYTGDEETPPLPFDPTTPADELPAGLTYEGVLGTNFNCPTNAAKVCHWVYIPAQGSQDAKWVACSGEINRITPPVE